MGGGRRRSSSVVSPVVRASGSRQGRCVPHSPCSLVLGLGGWWVSQLQQSLTVAPSGVGSIRGRCVRLTSHLPQGWGQRRPTMHDDRGTSCACGSKCHPACGSEWSGLRVNSHSAVVRACGSWPSRSRRTARAVIGRVTASRKRAAQSGKVQLPVCALPSEAGVGTPSVLACGSWRHGGSARRGASCTSVLELRGGRSRSTITATDRTGLRV